MAYVPTVWENDITEVDEDNMNHMEDGIKNSYNVSLLAVSDTAPSECNEGDKYYNTTTNEIYTATGTDTWGEDGEEPLQDILYVVFGEQNTYAYNGIEMLSVGGGSTSTFGDIVVDSIRSKNILNYYVNERTNYGIKMSMDSTKLFMDGTTNGSGLIYYVTSNTFLLKAGTYTISASVLSGSFTRNGQDIGIYVRNETTNTIIFSTTGAQNYANNSTITLNDDTPIIIYLNGSGSGFVASNLIIGLQIEEGTIATSYSPYQDLNNEDTGWVDMSAYVNTTNFTIRPGSGFIPMARRIGNRVYWRGEIYCTTAPSGSSATLLSTSIPANFLPIAQFSSCGVTYENNKVYNIFVSRADGIMVSQSTFTTQTQYTGYQLTNLSGYICE